MNYDTKKQQNHMIIQLSDNQKQSGSLISLFAHTDSKKTTKRQQITLFTYKPFLYSDESRRYGTLKKAFLGRETGFSGR